MSVVISKLTARVEELKADASALRSPGLSAAPKAPIEPTRFGVFRM